MKKEERLTFKYKNGKTNYLKYNNDGITDYKYQHGINCLAEYENTGLSPKEVAKLKKENAELKTRLEKADKADGEIIDTSKLSPEEFAFMFNKLQVEKSKINEELYKTKKAFCEILNTYNNSEFAEDPIYYYYNKAIIREGTETTEAEKALKERE